MKSFNDKEEGKWSIELTIGAVMRVKSESDGKFDLFRPEAEQIDGNSLSAVLLEDFAAFWELLWHLIEPQATKRETTAEQFGELMASDCLVAAQLAFFDEWHDFFLQAMKSDQAKALEKLMKYRQTAIKLVEEKMKDPMIDALDDKVESAMSRTLNASVGSLGESLGEILDHLPTANSS